MNINHLAIFHVVAQELSITRGAERLHISQPAVSKQLQEFEQALGTPLFDRLPRGVRLTEAGEVLAGYARRLFALESEAEWALAGLRGLETGRLTVGASMTIGGYLLPPALVSFHERHPGIDIHLEIANTGEIQERLLEGTLDMGFTEGFVDNPGLDATVFHNDELVVIAPPSHPLAKQRSTTPERICDEPFVMRERGSGTRAVVEHAFKQRGLTLKPALSLGNIEAIKRAVMAEVGLAMISSLAVALEIETGKLVTLSVEGFVVHRPLHRLSVRGMHQSHAARAFGTLLSTRHSA